MEEKTRKLENLLTDLVRDLVDIPTENHPPDGDEAPGQAYIKKIYGEAGLEIDEFSPEEIEGYGTNPAFLHERNLAGRKNVVGVWKGEGGGRSLVLCGHMDVAPKEPLPWTICEPFESIVQDGRIYGRGACDMKGGLACAAAAVMNLRESGFVPKGDIIIESVVDEEYASGNGTIASRLKGYNGDFAVVLEPSGMMVCPANVGSVMMNVSLAGDPGMPYTKEKIFNVAYALGDLIGALRELEEKREAGAYPALWKDAVQRRKMVITKVKAGEVKPQGQLSAPMDAWVEVSVQTYPGEKAASVVGEVASFVKKKLGGEAAVKVTPLYHYVEPASTRADHPGVTTLLECARKYCAKPAIVPAPFPCDLFTFPKYGNTPGVIFGPEGGNLHGPDEWVSIESLVCVTQALEDFIMKWCG
jgi:acetylornithine deacetylase